MTKWNISIHEIWRKNVTAMKILFKYKKNITAFWDHKKCVSIVSVKFYAADLVLFYLLQRHLSAKPTKHRLPAR